ncbi:RNA polymerase sigma factor [Desulforamulus ruminis]|uniref:RNA polymerase sigma factor, sigma-70 family n=1 Tax=Desulforamulus ruminis (strain ATCC 23193 / DSM 2154 / NCIMB 8452 / DL) TaxID=696281 RepID=F6DUG5_DESRL|nr:sigma-70 family RNA polymerase sigma factor [Desulforamulus ruminis]AEG59032.1 RNA polymerase sigma factor, sigma-70 family [Desulforamulus ruminis DSM 2154]
MPQDIIEKARTGDTGAFEAIVRWYQPGIFNVAFRILNDREEARDATQEVFIKLYSALASFRGEAKFTSWFYRIATNVCLDRYRRNKKSRAHTIQDRYEDIAPRAPTTARDDPAEIYQQKESLSALQELIADLPVKYRTVLILRHLEGLSYQEIADIMEIPVQTVGTQIHRAKAVLQKKMKPIHKGGISHEPDLPMD